MRSVSSGLRYTPDHVWIDAVDGRVGVTSHLLAAADPIAALHLPDVGELLVAGGSFGAIEVYKGVFDLYAPCDGRVVARNEAALAAPEKIGPETWLLRIDGRPGALMTQGEYERFVASSGLLIPRGRVR